MTAFRNSLRAAIDGAISLSEAQVDELEGHYELLVRWNTRLNLTTVLDPAPAAIRHYAESLWLGNLLPAGSLEIVDLGSGAGFPGFPIAVLRGESSVTLLESDRRKAVFLRESSVGLKNVEVWTGRSEDFRGRANWVVSRAVRESDVTQLAARLGARIGVLASEGQWHGVGSRHPMPWWPTKVAILTEVPRGTT